MERTELVNKWIGTGMLHGINDPEEREKLCQLLECFIQQWYADSSKYLTEERIIDDKTYSVIPWSAFQAIRVLYFAKFDRLPETFLHDLVYESQNYPNIASPHNIDDEVYLKDALLKKYLPED
jgi:hypothetical protein